MKTQLNNNIYIILILIKSLNFICWKSIFNSLGHFDNSLIDEDKCCTDELKNLLKEQFNNLFSKKATNNDLITSEYMNAIAFEYENIVKIA